MYGTIAKLNVAPGKLDDLLEVVKQYDRLGIPGMRWSHLYQSDDDPNVCWLAVAFDNRASYRANAENPEQNARYQAMRALLAADPQWHDGVVLQSIA